MQREEQLDLLPLFQQRKNEMLAFLRKLSLFETPSRVPESQDPIFAFLAKEFSAIGYSTFRMPGKKTGGYFYARPKARVKQNQNQLIVGHVDTVWPIGTLEKMPYEESPERVKGPGVYDMKAGITQAFFALKIFSELGLEPSVCPLIFFNSDEEIGSRESTKAIARLAKISNRAFVLEPPLGLEGKLKTARKGLARFSITVIGKAAHAGLNPEKGINAIVELSKLIQQLYEMNDPEAGTTVNIGMVEGGMAANVVAPTSKADVDVRALNQKDAELITQKIMGLNSSNEEVQVKIEGGFGRFPMERTSRNQKLWALAREKGKVLGLNLEQAIAGGGSDGNTTSLYTATLDGLGTVGDGAHAQHEFIFVDKLIERTALLSLLLLEGPIDH